MDTNELLTELPDCVLILDASGHVQWGNRAAERLFGRSLRDSIGFPALDLVHPDDLALVLRSLESVQRKEVGTLIEVRAKTPGGWRLLEVLGAPIGGQNETGTVLFCMRDLSERRRFEVAQGQDATFRTIVQNSPDMTILLAPSGEVTAVSGALSRILGHDPEVIERRPLGGFVVEEDREILLASLYTATLGATASNPLRVRVRFTRHESAAPVPFELSLVNLLDDPSVQGFVVSARDITAQVTAEKELHQSEQRFRRVFDQGPVGIVLTDFEQMVIDANGAFCRMVGQRPESVFGSLLQSFVHPDDRVTCVMIGRALAEDPSISHRGDVRLASSHDTIVVASITASLMVAEDGAPLHYLWAIEDVTDRELLVHELLAHANTAGSLLGSFTSREREVLELLEVTESASQIAEQLTLSVRTVEKHLANAYRKLGVHNRSAARAEYARLTDAVSGLASGSNGSGTS